MPNTSLSPEEQEYFASGGVSSLPDDYAKDIPPEPKQEDRQPTDDGGDRNGRGDNQPDDQSGRQNAEAGDRSQEQSNREGGDPEGQRGPVPYGALKSEREKRRDAERRAALIEERFNATLDMLQRQQPQQPASAQEQAPQLPDPMSDPLGAIQDLRQWRDEQTQTERQRREQEQEQVRQQQAQERLWQQVDADYTRVMTETFEDYPEVKEAREHLINSRVNELVAYGMSQQEAAQRASIEEFQMAHSALSRRQHPAHHVVASAEARGWKNPRRQQEQQGNGQGRPPGANPNAGGQGSDADRLAAVAAGQRANASVGAAGTGGNARGGRLSAKDLVDMPIKNFKKFLEGDADGEEWKRILGG